MVRACSRSTGTGEAMYAEVQVIYQAALADAQRVGYADLLLRGKRPRWQGPWSSTPLDGRHGSSAWPDDRPATHPEASGSLQRF